MSYLLLHWHEMAYLLLAIIFVATYVVHFLPGMKDSKLRKILEVETILMVVLEIGEWLDADPRRVLYRLVNIAEDGMESWFEEECARTSGSTNLGLKSIEGNRNVPRMSFAVFDEREVFLIARPLSGPFEATNTVRIEDPVVASYMAAYFGQIFEVGAGCR